MRKQGIKETRKLNFLFSLAFPGFPGIKKKKNKRQKKENIKTMNLKNTKTSLKWICFGMK